MLMKEIACSSTMMLGVLWKVSSGMLVAFKLSCLVLLPAHCAGLEGTSPYSLGVLKSTNLSLRGAFAASFGQECFFLSLMSLASFRLKGSGLKNSIQRAINYAPYCDLIWMETSHPTLSDAKEFAEGVRKEYPNKLFAYNCSPSFNWRKHLRYLLKLGSCWWMGW